MGPSLKTDITPKNWVELLGLFSLQKDHDILCLDEFPYLVASAPSLPGVLQRWLDHRGPKQFSLEKAVESSLRGSSH